MTQKILIYDISYDRCILFKNQMNYIFKDNNHKNLGLAIP